VVVPQSVAFDSNTFANLQIKPLIWVQAVIDSHKHSRVEYLVKARAQFKARSVANNVVITIPVPPDADSPQFQVRRFAHKFLYHNFEQKHFISTGDHGNS